LWKLQISQEETSYKDLSSFVTYICSWSRSLMRSKKNKVKHWRHSITRNLEKG